MRFLKPGPGCLAAERKADRDGSFNPEVKARRRRLRIATEEMGRLLLVFCLFFLACSSGLLLVVYQRCTGLKVVEGQRNQRDPY